MKGTNEHYLAEGSPRHPTAEKMITTRTTKNHTRGMRGIVRDQSYSHGLGEDVDPCQLVRVGYSAAVTMMMIVVRSSWNQCKLPSNDRGKSEPSCFKFPQTVWSNFYYGETYRLYGSDRGERGVPGTTGIVHIYYRSLLPRTWLPKRKTTEKYT